MNNRRYISKKIKQNHEIVNRNLLIRLILLIHGWNEKLDQLRLPGHAISRLSAWWLVEQKYGSGVTSRNCIYIKKFHCFAGFD